LQKFSGGSSAESVRNGQRIIARTRLALSEIRFRDFAFPNYNKLMRRHLIVLVLCLFSAVAVAGARGLPKKPNNREWTALQSDYASLEAMRRSMPQPAPNATRKERIELLLSNLKKLEPTVIPFHDRLLEYYERTGDPRAATLYASEKIRLGDDYLNVLGRSEKAISMYQSALSIDPQNESAKQRIAVAEARRFATMDAFASVKNGMKESDVQQLIGMPPEDWIKQVVQNKRAYSVWIYPKRDGGAAAVYFDSGLVYHTNWNAAPAPAVSDANQSSKGEGVKK
jgi:tetratricopeptide (TPR) repeat protein